MADILFLLHHNLDFSVDENIDKKVRAFCKKRTIRELIDPTDIAYFMFFVKEKGNRFYYTVYFDKKTKEGTEKVNEEEKGERAFVTSKTPVFTVAKMLHQLVNKMIRPHNGRIESNKNSFITTFSQDFPERTRDREEDPNAYNIRIDEVSKSNKEDKLEVILTKILTMKEKKVGGGVWKKGSGSRSSSRSKGAKNRSKK